MFSRYILTAAPGALALRGLPCSQRAMLRTTSTPSRGSGPPPAGNKNDMNTWEKLLVDSHGPDWKTKLSPAEQRILHAKWQRHLAEGNGGKRVVVDKHFENTDNALVISAKYIRWLQFIQEKKRGDTEQVLDEVEDWARTIQGHLEINHEEELRGNPAPFKVTRLTRQKIAWLERMQETFGEDWRAVVAERI